MFHYTDSKLLQGITHAKYNNQAAKNVACIAELLKRANRRPMKLRNLGFYLIAPQNKIEEGIFDMQMSLSSIRKTVERRVTEYDESKEQWFNGWFLPTINKISIRKINWEEIISYIRRVDSYYEQDIE